MRKVLTGALVLVGIGVAYLAWGAFSDDAGRPAPARALAVAPDGGVPPAPYRVVSTKDDSAKALGDRPLSSYSLAEIEALPLVRRVVVNAVLAGGITQEQVEPTLDAIISQFRDSDRDLDEVVVFLNSEEGRVGQGFDIGRAVWAFGGNLGNATAAIAENNLRAGYSTTYDIQPDVETYLANRNSTDEMFGLTVEQRRQYFREVGQAGIRSYRDADARIDPNTNLEANMRLSGELYGQYVAEIREKYGLNEEQHRELMAEGLAKGWPQ